MKKILSILLIIFIFLLSNNFTYTIYAKSLEITSDLFRISKVEQVSSNSLILHFTNPIGTDIELPSAFTLLHGQKVVVSSGTMNLSVYKLAGKSNAVVLHLKNYTLKPDVRYTVKLQGYLSSLYGVYLGQRLGDQISFTGTSYEEAQFKFMGATALSDNSIQLDFNKPLDRQKAMQISKYTVVKSKTNAVAKILNATIVNNSYGYGCGVVLNSINQFDIKTKYDIQVSSILDATNKYSLKNQKYSFTAISDITAFKLVSVTPINTNCIEVNFNQKLDPNLAQDASKYQVYRIYDYTLVNDSKGSRIEPLYRTETPIKVVYSDEHPYSVKLYFWYDNPLFPISKCTLTISSDLKTGKALSNKITYEFITNDLQKPNFEMNSAVFLDENTLKISFNYDISQNGINMELTNYYIEDITGNVMQTPLAIKYHDLNTIILEFKKLDLKKIYYLNYYNFVDITGQTYTGMTSKTILAEGLNL